MNHYKSITIIGLGYVGLPLAVAFAKKYPVVGFDISTERIDYLKKGLDLTLEVEKEALLSVLKNGPESDKPGLWPTDKIEETVGSRYYIVTVPTPIDISNKPDLEPLKKASTTVGKVLKKGDYVIFESTVFPGATEEFCVPILEKVSGLRLNTDFFVGYSPERINPGDKEHTVEKILKVTSGSTPEAAQEIDQLYKEIITAGTFKASSIKVAEAAKVIENSQRDVNIAFVNELAKIFGLMGIDTHEVLEAAGTKWNFLPFKPGLVGGHCIGVDPYYLAQKAQEVGYHPEIILAGRRLNDSMGQYVATQVIKLMHQHEVALKDSRVLLLGITFKENCPDIRNTGAISIITELKSWGLRVDVYDPWASPEEVEREYGIQTLKERPSGKYQAIVLAVAHTDFAALSYDNLLDNPGIIYDVKGFLPVDRIDGRL